MERVSRILVADDLVREEKAEPPAVVRLARDIAEAMRAELNLVHAYRMPELSVPDKALSLIEVPYVEGMAKALEAERDRILAAGPGVPVDVAVEKGDTVEVVLEDVASRDCQLVILGTHGRKGMRRALLGSVAEEVVRRSTVPVLTINPHADLGAFSATADSTKRYKPARIVVPIDFSPSTEEVLDAAGTMARAFGSAVTLMHVIEEWAYPVVQSASLLAGGFMMPLEKDLRELGNTRYAELKELGARLSARGIDVQTRLVERAVSVGDAVVEAAETLGAGMIVIGNRHASRIEYAVLGSTNRFVVREAHCPVLSVPAPGAAIAAEPIRRTA